MLEVKELQYFVVCADLSSFSRAAEVLYTTQPNVSKVIRSLEEKLGFEVFERDNRGIKLTRRGRQAYEYAGKILEQERQLAQIYKIDDREEFSISSNPSSWVARCFTDYYIKYSDENVRYNIMEGSVNSVIKRVGTGLDELGFIFCSCNQCSHIERVDLFVFQVFGYVSPEDTMRQSFYDSCLTCTRFTNQDRIVLGSAA